MLVTDASSLSKKSKIPIIGGVTHYLGKLFTGKLGGKTDKHAKEGTVDIVTPPREPPYAIPAHVPQRAHTDDEALRAELRAKRFAAVAAEATPQFV